MVVGEPPSCPLVWPSPRWVDWSFRLQAIKLANSDGQVELIIPNVDGKEHHMKTQTKSRVAMYICIEYVYVCPPIPVWECI